MIISSFAPTRRNVSLNRRVPLNRDAPLNQPRQSATREGYAASQSPKVAALRVPRLGLAQLKAAGELLGVSLIFLVFLTLAAIL